MSAVWSITLNGRHAVELDAEGMFEYEFRPYTWRLLEPDKPEITMAMSPGRWWPGAHRSRYDLYVHVPKRRRWSRDPSFRVGFVAEGDDGARRVCRELARVWVNGIDDPRTTLGRNYWMMAIDRIAYAAN